MDSKTLKRTGSPGPKMISARYDRLWTLPHSSFFNFETEFLTLRFVQKLLYVPQELFSFSSTVIESLAGNMTAQNKDDIFIYIDVAWVGSSQ